MAAGLTYVRSEQQRISSEQKRFYDYVAQLNECIDYYEKDLSTHKEELSVGKMPVGRIFDGRTYDLQDQRAGCYYENVQKIWGILRDYYNDVPGEKATFYIIKTTMDNTNQKMNNFLGRSRIMSHWVWENASRNG